MAYMRDKGGRRLDAFRVADVAGLLSTSGTAPLTAPHPDFVRTGQTFYTAASTGLTNPNSGGVASVYWPKTIDISALSWAPKRFMSLCSTDHAEPGGIAVSFHDDPLVAGVWTVITIAGLPSPWTSTETPTPIVDLANNRLVILFQAEYGVGGRQNSHVMVTANGTAFTWLAELPQFDSAMMGDGHGGYCGVPFPYGDGWALYSLAGGTNYGLSVLRVSTDLVTWTHTGQQIPFEDPTQINEWPRAQFFTWRGQPWALFNSTPPVSGANAVATYTVTVARIAPDMRTPVTRPVKTLTGSGASTDNAIESIVAYDGKLIGYYRDGGQSGSVKIAIAEG